MRLKVKDAMVEDVVTVEWNASVKEAVMLMNENDVGCLIVVKRGKAVGIVTERDMLTRVLAVSLNPEKTDVAGIMSSPLIVADPSLDLEEAARLMFKRKIKKLPVVSNRKVVGLLTLTDLARFQPQIIKLFKKMITQGTPRRLRKVVGYYIA